MAHAQSSGRPTVRVGGRIQRDEADGNGRLHHRRELPFFNHTPPISVAAPTAAHRPDGLPWQVAWASALLEDTLSPEELATSNAVIERWAATLSTLAQYMRDHPGDRDIRLVTAAHMLGDQGRDIAQALLIAGISSENASALLNEETVVDFFARLPFNGGVLEITQARLRNASDK